MFFNSKHLFQIIDKKQTENKTIPKYNNQNCFDNCFQILITKPLEMIINLREFKSISSLNRLIWLKIKKILHIIKSKHNLFLKELSQFRPTLRSTEKNETKRKKSIKRQNDFWLVFREKHLSRFWVRFQCKKYFCFLWLRFMSSINSCKQYLIEIHTSFEWIPQKTNERRN